MAWACMAASGTGSLVFIDDMQKQQDKFRNIQSFTICSDSAKCCKTDRMVLHSHLLKTKLRAKRPIYKQQLKAAAAKVWRNISREETQHWVMSMVSRPQAVRDCKRFSSLLNIYIFIIMLVCQITFEPLKKGDQV